jgi:DNA-binding NtrC family response regulator
MKQTRLKKRAPKTVWVLESDRENQLEIQEVLSHQNHWEFVFFKNPSDFKKTKFKKMPMAILLDMQHFSENSLAKFSFKLVEELKQSFPETELLVFSDAEHEAMALETLKHGALDYIIVGQHQYVKLEYELRWLEDVLEERMANRAFLKKLFWLIGFMIAFLIAIIVLHEMGIIDEGTETEVLIGI